MVPVCYCLPIGKKILFLSKTDFIYCWQLSVHSVNYIRNVDTGTDDNNYIETVWHCILSAQCHIEHKHKLIIDATATALCAGVKISNITTAYLTYIYYLFNNDYQSLTCSILVIKATLLTHYKTTHIKLTHVLR